MKTKLILLCLALFCGLGGVKAEVTWESTDTKTGVINCYGFGISLPDVTGVDADKAYNVSSFTISLRGSDGSNSTKELYMAIATERASNYYISSSKVIAISTNKPAAGAASFEYKFKGLTLYKGVTYYVHFFASDTPTDGSYEEKQQGIKVGTSSSSTYSPGVIDVGWNVITNMWPPIFSATLTEGMLISPSTGNYTNTNDKGTYASKWTSAYKAPSLQLSTTANNIATGSGNIYSGGTKCTYTISVLPGYLITGYKVKGKALEASKDQTITPVDDIGHPVVFTSTTDNTVTISGIEMASTTFTLSGENKGLSISEFRVYVKRDPSISTLVSTLKTNMEAYKDLSGVGYPKSDAAARTNLNTAYSEINSYTGSTEDYIKCINYASELDAYNNYLACTDINMPEEGKTYKIQNVRYDGGTPYYLYNNSGVIAASSALVENNRFYFVAHKLPGTFRSTGADKYFFVAKGTNLHFVCADKSDKAMTNGYEPAYEKSGAKYDLSAIGLQLYPKTADVTANERIIGALSLWGVRKNSPSYEGVIIVKSADGSLENYHTNQFFDATYSTLYRFIEVDTEDEPYYNTVNMRQAGDHSYATTYLPFAVELPGNVKAYKASASGEVLRLSKVADGTDSGNNVLPALTPAILWSENAAVTGNTTLSIVNSNLEAPDDNVLSGTVADNTTVSSTTYVLSGNATSAGFYPLSGTIAPICKAYYDAGTANVKAFRFSFGEDDATAIGNLITESLEGESGTIYNLSGQRLSKMQKGINIINGKKILK